MANKLNIAEILKDCPKDMELDCLLFDGAVLECVVDDDSDHPIWIRTKECNICCLTSDGCWDNFPSARCVIFPKGKTTWEGFVPPCKFNDGDVISDSLGTCIFKGEGKLSGTVDFYCGIGGFDTFDVKDEINKPYWHYGNIVNYRLATEEEKESLFKAIKDNGYKWNAETKTLEKLTEPKFKDGDVVANQNDTGTWIGIYHRHNSLIEAFSSYCYIRRDGIFCADSDDEHLYGKTRLATEEEKQKLFDAIKDNGYKWYPKTKTLEKLTEPKFKDGDVISDSLGTCIFKGEGWIKGTVDYYCGAHGDYFNVKDHKNNPDGHYGDIVDYRLATEEEKEKLFQAIKDNGYKWNTETKTLEELVVPKFKVGDRIRHKTYIKKGNVVTEIKNTCYILDDELALPFVNQDLYELVPDKFDIATLKPFESKVLVRDYGYSIWQPSVWGLYDKGHRYPYITTGGHHWKQCIPYEGNEHLFGKTDECGEYYKTWE